MPGQVFYYADEFNLSWMPTLKAMWSPKGQQVMIQTPGQPTKHYGIGAVNYHTGQNVVLFRRRKRRREVAELLSRFSGSIGTQQRRCTLHGTMPQPTRMMKLTP